MCFGQVGTVLTVSCRARGEKQVLVWSTCGTSKKRLLLDDQCIGYERVHQPRVNGALLGSV